MSRLPTIGRVILRDAVTLTTALAGTRPGTTRHSILGTTPGTIRGTMATMIPGTTLPGTMAGMTPGTTAVTDGDGTAITAGTVVRTTMVEAMLTAPIAIPAQNVMAASAVRGHVVSATVVTTATAEVPSAADGWLTAAPSVAVLAPMWAHVPIVITAHVPMEQPTAVPIATRTATSEAAAPIVAATHLLAPAAAATAVAPTLPHVPAATAEAVPLAAAVPVAVVAADALAVASAVAEDKFRDG